MIIGFKSFLNFSLVNQYLAITLALTNVDFRSNATCVSATTTNSRTNRWRQRLVKVIKRGKILDSSLLYYTLYSLLGVKKKFSSTTCMRFLDSRLRSTSGRTSTSPQNLLSPLNLHLIMHLLWVSKNWKGQSTTWIFQMGVWILHMCSP